MSPRPDLLLLPSLSTLACPILDYLSTTALRATRGCTYPPPTLPSPLPPPGCPTRSNSALAATFAACTCLRALGLTSCDGYYMVRTSHLDTSSCADASPLLVVVLMPALCVGYRRVVISIDCVVARRGSCRGVEVRPHRRPFAPGHHISRVPPSRSLPSWPALIIVAESTCPASNVRTCPFNLPLTPSHCRVPTLRRAYPRTLPAFDSLRSRHDAVTCWVSLNASFPSRPPIAAMGPQRSSVAVVAIVSRSTPALCSLPPSTLPIGHLELAVSPLIGDLRLAALLYARLDSLRRHQVIAEWISWPLLVNVGISLAACHCAEALFYGEYSPSLQHAACSTRCPAYQTPSKASFPSSSFAGNALPIVSVGLPACPRVHEHVRRRDSGMEPRRYLADVNCPLPRLPSPR